jgi:hypothetical protein
MDQIIYRIKVPLESQDKNFLQIQDLIEAKRNLLFQKQKKLRFITKQNRFLEEVQKDYSKYYGYIVKQKNDQIQALGMLESYIRDLTKSGNLTKHNIEDAKEEQIKILDEIKLIQEGLDSIMNETDNVHLSLKEKIT